MEEFQNRFLPLKEANFNGFLGLFVKELLRYVTENGHYNLVRQFVTLQVTILRSPSGKRGGRRRRADALRVA